MVRVRLALDEEFRREPESTRMARKQLAEASRLFERDVGLAWVPAEIVPWRSTDSAPSLTALLDELEYLDSPNVDLVLGFSGQLGPSTGSGRYAQGRARYYGRVAIVRLDAAGVCAPRVARTVAHELGHVLGAWHSRRKDSVMYVGSGRAAVLRFDPQNLEAIRLARDLDFRRGAVSLSLPTLRRLEALWRADHDPSTPVPARYARASQ